MRGSEANHVLVLVDGVRANDPATGDEFRWEYLATANIERIEVVRGAQSALWGSDAIGGVVHIITRSGAESSGFDGYLEGGSDDTMNGAVSGSLQSDRWSFGFGLEQLSTDGSNISRTGTETVCGRGERTHRTDLHGVPGEVRGEREIGEGVHLGGVPSVLELDQRVTGDLV